MSNVRNTPSRTRRADLFRAAARRMEDRERNSDYPCWNIAILDGLSPEHWRDSRHVREFLSAFSGAADVTEQSNDYLDNIEIDYERDACILSLCFMAAMVERGDA